MKETTLKEIAQTLGISITTVSKALKNYSDVSPKTKNAVLEIAKKTHYHPNTFAVNLRTRESKTIGLIIPDVMHHFLSCIINGIIEQAEKNGYLVIILQSNESIELEKKQVELLLNKRVDGILMSLSDESNSEDHIKEILNRKIPLVMFDKISKLINCSKVVINDQNAAMYAVQHLIDQGCKKIVHIRGLLNPQNAIDRFLGYKKTLEKNNIPFDPKLVYTSTKLSIEEGFNIAQKIVADHPDVDGIFVVTDLMAIGVLNHLNKLGISVPKQIAVVGFSNWFMSEYVTPKLSTIEQPSSEMGVVAFNLLLDDMNNLKEGLPPKPKIVELETSLIIRESSLKQ